MAQTGCWYKFIQVRGLTENTAGCVNTAQLEIGRGRRYRQQFTASICDLYLRPVFARALVVRELSFLPRSGPSANPFQGLQSRRTRKTITNTID